VQESTLPILVEESALDTDSAGAGKYRGGLGYRRTFRMLSETATLQLNIDRHTCLPWGLHGGQPARPNRAYIQASPDGDWELVLKRDGIRLELGARVQLIGGGGGGWGDPQERDAEGIKRDVALGYVSAQAAADAYGIKADQPANLSEMTQ
jgi:N-methylhydantoinase B